MNPKGAHLPDNPPPAPIEIEASPTSCENSKQEEAAQAKLESVKRYLFGALLKVMTPDEIRLRLRKLESKRHQVFE